MKEDLEWLTVSDRRKTAEQVLSQYREIWDAAAGIKLPQEPDAAEGWNDLSQRIAQAERGPRRFLGLRPVFPVLAASAIAVLVVVTGFLMRPQTVATGRGERHMMVLADGSEVVLNAESELRLGWGFGERHRRLTLHGEAFFSVTRASHPFVVVTELSEIEVLGTQFNVRARDDSVEVGVTRGVVEVSVGQGDQRQSVRVSAGQFTRCTRNGFPAPPSSVRTSQYPPWKYDQLFFDHTPLLRVCQEIECAFDVQVSIDDPKLASVEVTGLLRGTEPDALIGSLCMLIDCDFEFVDGRYRIL